MLQYHKLMMFMNEKCHFMTVNDSLAAIRSTANAINLLLLIKECVQRESGNILKGY